MEISCSWVYFPGTIFKWKRSSWNINVVVVGLFYCLFPLTVYNFQSGEKHMALGAPGCSKRNYLMYNFKNIAFQNVISGKQRVLPAIIQPSLSKTNIARLHKLHLLLLQKKVVFWRWLNQHRWLHLPQLSFIARFLNIHRTWKLKWTTCFTLNRHK